MKASRQQYDTHPAPGPSWSHHDNVERARSHLLIGHQPTVYPSIVHQSLPETACKAFPHSRAAGQLEPW